MQLKASQLLEILEKTKKPEEIGEAELIAEEIFEEGKELGIIEAKIKDAEDVLRQVEDQCAELEGKSDWLKRQLRDEEEKYESIRERYKDKKKKVDEIRSIAKEAGFDSLDESLAYIKENRNLKKRNEELEGRVEHLQEKSEDLESGISEREELIEKKKSILNDLKKEIARLRVLELNLSENIDRNSETIKLALLIFAMADRRIERMKKYGIGTP